MRNLFTVFRKEFNSFFSSPAAWLFLGLFLTVNLFVFFWGEAFFARNIADMKPLFKWMPILLIFLVAALTMRSWAEERRSGTLESLLTCPLSPFTLVMGKFLASLALVFLALLLTLPMPVTVSFLGPLDIGPVIGGYAASLFLAAAYIAIGLYMSGRSDNPIVALILTVAVGGLFYLLGSNTITSLFGHHIGGFLQLIGTGSRFDSITRGILDVRDIYYYISIVGIFLTLNLYSLERIRWAGNVSRSRHKQWGWLTGLAIINFILVNIWLTPIGTLRMDLTQGHVYSLSPVTKQYMRQLQEPLLIRGYFSAKSHPLLEPLVPQIKDLLKEYQIAGGDNVRIEFIDPHTDQTLEEEAAEKYNIHPVPFRMASRYQAGVVNSYFNIVVAYGDQYESLSFEDLIEVKAQTTGEPEVLLNNPEYAITRALRKVSNAYQAGGDIFEDLQNPITFSGYISADEKLPEDLAVLSRELRKTMEGFREKAGDKLNIEFADPDDNDGALGRELQEKFGFSPQIASLFNPKPFWFYMVLKGGGETVQVPLPAELNVNELKKSIESAMKRMAPGYLKTVAIVTPPAPQANPYMAQMGMAPPGGKRYTELRKMLAENVRVLDTDLKDGKVPADADLLLLLAPEDIDEKQLFAVDQFLMQGGSVMVTTSPFDVEITNTLKATNHKSGLESWLSHNGLNIDESMVLDPQNAALPVPVRRNLGPVSVQEIQMMPYPHFPDIRQDGLNKTNPMTAALGQLTLNWASPVKVDAEKNRAREVVKLFHSSRDSWTSKSLNILPDYRQYPNSGFKAEGDRAPQLLGVAVKGSFTSWFSGKKSPLLDKEDGKEKEEKEVSAETPADSKAESKTVVSSVIEHSSDSAGIMLIASNTFATDKVLALSSQGQGHMYTQALEFIQNGIDWFLDDQGLLSIRSRAQFARTLIPMEQNSRLFWEYLNYALALLGLIFIWLWRRMQQKRKQSHYKQILAEV